jgi:MFS family permease
MVLLLRGLVPERTTSCLSLSRKFCYTRAVLWGLTRYQWTVFVAAWLGWGFDVFDGLLFNFVAPLCVPRLLGVAPGDARVPLATGAITSLLLVGWATGGILFGWVTDRIGRSRTLLVTMVIYSMATAACAFAPNLWVLAACRFVASLGIGGEWAAGATLVAEVLPEERRIAGGALLYTSAPLGILLAGSISDLFTRQIAPIASDPDLAWRLVFLSGLVPAAVALWIRRSVREPELWTAEQGAPARLGELFLPEHRRATLGGLGLAVVTLVTWWAMSAFLPFVVPHGMAYDSIDERFALVARANRSFTLGGLVGTVAAIPLARLGRRRLFALYLVGAAAAIWGTFAIASTADVRIALLFVCGAMTFGIVGTFTFYFPELFPTRLRGTGSGFCFNTGRYLAAIGPFVVGRALGTAGDPADAIKWVALVPLVGCALTPFVVETRALQR